MRMIMILSFFSLFATLSLNATEKNVTFFEGDFESAKIKAGEEGKLFFVDFYASWCTPCNWMDETAFRDTEVIQLLNKDYIAYKVDIDKVDGYAWKQQYQIKMLPTILIFNSSGELIERVEETLSARKLAFLLKKYNQEENKKVVKHDLNQSPTSIGQMKKLEQDELLEESTVKQNPDLPVYRIQLGVFKEFENTNAMVNDLQSRFYDPVIVLNDVSNGNVVYKVMMGEFNSLQDAESFRNSLKSDYGIDGIIK